MKIETSTYVTSKQCQLSTANGLNSLPENALQSTGELLSYH